jgi:predicted amidohydrolase
MKSDSNGPLLGGALITEVLFGDTDGEGLRDHLSAAKQRGAQLALLPELPLNPWSPARRTAREEDEETVGGPRHERQAAAARDVGIAVLGGAIVTDPGTARRHNTALLEDRATLLALRRLAGRMNRREDHE